ncbi:hypothetical protein M404DRAFT_37725, partial [Pisolithus tinctorius Marx 270]
ILFWLEVLSLLEMVGKGVDALGTVATWLQVNGSKDTLALVKDGIKLIQNFGSVIVHSTPHLYASALPFIPSNALLSMMLLPKFPRLARVAVGGLKGWPVEQQLLHGHTSEVSSVAFSPDGKRIVSGSSDKTVRVWDVEGGVQIGRPLEGHTEEVSSVAFSPDGKRIVSGSKDKTVRVWDVEGGVQIGSPLVGHTDAVESVAFSPGGKRIVSGSRDKTVRVWENEHQAVKLHDDGWIRGPKGQLLLWIPPKLRSPFYSMWTIQVIPRGCCTELDLSQMVHGKEWCKCFQS